MLLSRKWLVCLGCFLIQFVIFGIHNNFGLIFRALLHEFNQSDAATAWIGSLAFGLTFFVSPLSQIITTWLGFKASMLISTALCITALIGSSFVTRPELLPLTFSVVWGTGAGLAYHASLVVLQQNFEQKLSMANGIASSGSGVGGLSLGPLLSFFLEQYDFRWAFRAFAFIHLLFLFSILFVKTINKKKETVFPTESECIDMSPNDNNNDSECKNYDQTNEGKKESGSSVPNNGTDNSRLMSTSSIGEIDKSGCTGRICLKKKHLFKEVFDRNLWLNKKYITLLLGMSVFLFGAAIPYIFLVESATRKGIPIAKAKFLLGIMAITSTCTKILSGILLESQQFVSRKTLFIMSMYILTGSQFIVVFARNYWNFCVFAVLYGVGEGCLVGQLAAVIVDLIPCKSKVGVAIGNLFAIMSIPLMLGPLFGGKLSASTNSYATPFFLSAGFHFAGALISSLMLIYKSESSTITVESSTGGVTTIQLLDPSLLCSRQSLILSNSYSVTFTSLTRMEKYRQRNIPLVS